jgi:hypothetical protein
MTINENKLGMFKMNNSFISIAAIFEEIISFSI